MLHIQSAPEAWTWLSLFGSEMQLPTVKQCIGHGIDGRFTKTSAGFLELPTAVFDRLRTVRDLVTRFATDPAALFSGVFPGATCLLDHEGALLAISEEFEELAEQPRFDLVGRRLDELWAEPDARREWSRRLTRAMDPWTFVGRIRTPRNGNLHVSASLKPLQPGELRDRVWAASLTDMTEVTALRAAADRGNANQVNLEQLTRTLSHDLQAPLNSLGKHARWLLEAVGTDVPEDVNSTISEISDLTARMQNMVDGIVQFSTLSQGDAAREIVDLDLLLAEAIANLNSLIDETGATIEPQPLPTLAVNRNQMVQVFQNLLSNAIKFCSERVPRVRVNAKESGGRWYIQFEDNGIGIRPADTERIFGMFQRLHSESEYPGIGAGLAICKRIVEAHGGRITVTSAPGRGSCFTVELAASATRPNDADAPLTEVMG
jgi:signal transduction histidine kinase